MIGFRSSAALLALAAGLAGMAEAQVYRWVDKDGKVHYSEQAPTPDESKRVERKNLAPSVLPGGEAHNLRQARETFPVTLYTAPNCESGCEQARALLKRHGIPYMEKSVDSAESLDALKRITGGGASVPTLQVGSKKSVGFEEERWTTLLDAAGYPLRK